MRYLSWCARARLRPSVAHMVYRCATRRQSCLPRMPPEVMMARAMPWHAKHLTRARPDISLMAPDCTANALAER